MCAIIPHLLYSTVLLATRSCSCRAPLIPLSQRLCGSSLRPFSPLRFYNHFRFLSHFFGLHFSLSVTIPTQYGSLETYPARIHNAQSLLSLLSLSRTAWWSGPIPGARKECEVSFLVVSSRLFHPFSPSVPSAACFTFSKFVIYPRISLQSLITDPLAIERT